MQKSKKISKDQPDNIHLYIVLWQKETLTYLQGLGEILQESGIFGNYGN